MALFGMKYAVLAVALAQMSGSCEAWMSPATTSSLTARNTFSKSALFMAEEEPDKVQLTSGKKEIMFDDEKGRFFETSLDAEDCIPDEEFCTLDETTGKKIRLTVAEKERIFIDSLQSYYVNGRQLLSDSDFDLLKEDLQWNGSPVVALNRDEAKYLAAMQEYMKGSPMMSDDEFDALKLKLKEEGSKIAVETDPKCYIDTGVCKVTLQEDKFRSNLLYLPAGAVLFIAWLGLGFEVIEPIIRLNPLFLILLGSPLVYNGSKFITENYIFQDNFIAYGPCPSCGTENRVYFGNILGVEGFSDLAEIKCDNCKSEISVQRNTLRASTLPKA